MFVFSFYDSHFGWWSTMVGACLGQFIIGSFPNWNRFASMNSMWNHSMQWLSVACNMHCQSLDKYLQNQWNGTAIIQSICIKSLQNFSSLSLDSQNEWKPRQNSILTHSMTSTTDRTELQDTFFLMKKSGEWNSIYIWSMIFQYPFYRSQVNPQKKRSSILYRSFWMLFNGRAYNLHIITGIEYLEFEVTIISQKNGRTREREMKKMREKKKKYFIIIVDLCDVQLPIFR